MARAKTPAGETPEQTKTRQLLDTIANVATRGEKVSFDRKFDNMVSLLSLVKPIEDQILDLMAQKVPIIEQIEALRKTMIGNCIHPMTHLTVHNNTVHCKFCNRTFSVLSHG